MTYLQQKAKHFISDKNGSDATEMVVTTAMLAVFIMLCLMILIYILEANMVHFATLKVTRNIETLGYYTDAGAQDMYVKALGETEYLPKAKRVIKIRTNPLFSFKSGSQTRIKLKGTFDVTGEAVYRVKVVHPGVFDGFNIDLPIKVNITGMSEKYWGG